MGTLNRHPSNSLSAEIAYVFLNSSLSPFEHCSRHRDLRQAKQLVLRFCCHVQREIYQKEYIVLSTTNG